jgi:uncharacterized protein YegP (UPF0339 family)
MKTKSRFEIFSRRSNRGWQRLLPAILRKTCWYWRLVAANGEIIAVGTEPFASKENTERAIEVVRHHVAKAEVMVN